MTKVAVFSHPRLISFFILSLHQTLALIPFPLEAAHTAMAAPVSSSAHTSSVEGSIKRWPRHASSSSPGQIHFVQGSSPSSSTVPSLPLVDCPDCGERIHRYVSHTKKNPNRVYYKYPNRSERNAPCDFWYWEEFYHQYLIDHGLLMGDGSKEEMKGEDESFEEDEDEDKASKKKLINVVLEMRAEVKQQTFYLKMATFGIVIFGAVLLGMLVVVVAKGFL